MMTGRGIQWCSAHTNQGNDDNQDSDVSADGEVGSINLSSSDVDIDAGVTRAPDDEDGVDDRVENAILQEINDNQGIKDALGLSSSSNLAANPNVVTLRDCPIDATDCDSTSTHLPIVMGGGSK